MPKNTFHPFHDFTGQMRRPWNLPSYPVYSISSLGNGIPNMNICTYAIPVSMQPKRYVISIFKGTKTLDNVLEYPHFILQLLSEDQYRLVSSLGRRSGHHGNKLLRLREPVTEWNGFKLLGNAVAAIQCCVCSFSDAGDHLAFLCEVKASRHLRDTEILTTGFLREKGIIRA